MVGKKWTVLAMGSVAYFLQQGSLLVALSQLSATRYVRVTPCPSRRCRAFPDYAFSFGVILQRHSGFAFCIGVGEDALQCDFRAYCHTFACIASHLSSKTHAQTVRFTPAVLGLVISFASDTRYSLNDVRETLPGYLALLLHILSTGALEHLRSMLAPSIGAKYVSTCNIVGAATFSLVVYVARETLVSISPSSSTCC